MPGMRDGLGALSAVEGAQCEARGQLRDERYASHDRHAGQRATTFVVDTETSPKIVSIASPQKFCGRF